MNTEELYEKMTDKEKERYNMRYALRNKNTKEIIIINTAQLKLLRKLFEKKFMLESDWSIDEIVSVESCLDELTEQ